MFPHERSLVKNLSGKPFALIGVNSDQKLSTPQGLTKDGTVTWRSFQNGDRGTQTISQAFGVTGWPTIYLIDAEGVVRYKNPGRGEALNEKIAELLAEVDVEFPHEKVISDEKAEKAKTAGGKGKAKPNP